MRQSGRGELERYGAVQFGVGGPVSSNLKGMRAGLEYRHLDFSLSYDELQHRQGFGGGTIVSPYGDHAAMYAGEMTEHLLKYGPGHVFELKATSGLPGDPLRLTLGVLAFRTRYSSDPNALYFDGRFSLRRWLPGLSGWCGRTARRSGAPARRSTTAASRSSTTG